MIGSQCKCGAETLGSHMRKIKNGYAAHTYQGFFWESKDKARREVNA